MPELSIDVKVDEMNACEMYHLLCYHIRDKDASSEFKVGAAQCMYFRSGNEEEG